MKLLNSRYQTLFCILFITSCSVTKNHQRNTIEGGYKITKSEKLEINRCELSCVVFDKRSNLPIANAIVRINELRREQFTNEKGVVQFTIPIETYKITAINVGNTTIETSPIEIKSGSEMEIKFDLGSTIIYCD